MPQQIRALPTDSTMLVCSSFVPRMQAALSMGMPTTQNWQPVPTLHNGDTAIIQITGVISRYPSFWQELFGGASTEDIGRQLAMCIASSDVKNIVFNIDSPGGQASGIPQLADQIFEARKSGKTLTAQCNGMMCSAAYYIASQCDKIYAGHSSDTVGSIGTVACYYDESKAFEKQGVEAVVLASGEMKGIGIPGAPITEEQRKELQARVDSTNSYFLEAVQRGRGMDAKQVASVADGRVWPAKDAMTNGLIDGIQTLQATVATLAGASVVPKNKGKSMAAATYAEIKAECVGAPADFIVQCLDTGVEVSQAKANWQAKLNQIQIDKDAKFVAMEKENGELKTQVTTLQTELAAAKKKPAGFIPAGGTATTHEGKEDQSEVSAKDQFFALVNADVAKGNPRNKAVSNVARSNPEIHAAFLAEMKGGK